MLSSVTAVLKDATLSQVGGVWTLLWKGREYMRLLGAHSREHAEQQIAEMLFVRATPDSASNAAANPVVARSSADTTWPSRADLHYFNSDMTTACMYLDMSRRPGADAENLIRRAQEISAQIADWVNANGGHADLEQRLIQFRWHLAAAKSRSDSAPRS